MAAMLARMMRTPAATSPVETAISMLAATTVRGGEDAAIQRLLGLVAQQGSDWQRSALLRGVEVAVLGAAMPGSAGGRRTGPAAPPTAAALPCATCPGGRGGPGGAYAFPRPPNWRSGQGQSGTDLRLTRAPAEFVALAASGDPLAQRAGAVLAKVVWPGKPGAPAAAVPLTPAEIRHFEDGRELYKNVCQGCHQPDGRGQDRIAPSLVGSVLALAPADIAARVLLHGKEGAIGLMPPIGASFSDEQVAAVLTYIRREWGHSASPVTPGQVTKLRAATRSRTRPWRHDELLKLLPPDPALRQ
jgi:mono/diheme cytochrome c family protein